MVRNQKGFALPAVLLLLLLVSALVAVQLTSAQFITKHLGSQSHKTVALYAADGMVEYGLAVMPDTLSIGDSVSIGSHTFASNLLAEISLLRTDNDTTDTLQAYTLYGEGQFGASVSRIVAFDIVVRGNPLWNVPAGFVALGGLDKNGNSGLISGADVCGDSVPAIIAADSVMQNGNPIDAPGDTTPWIDGPGLEYSDSLSSSLGFDEWETIRNTPSDADFLVNSIFDWPTAADFAAGWPSVYMNGTFELTSSHSGRGVLIAPDDLTFGTGFTWEGIILIGGAMTKNGEANLEGTIATGLNELLGMPVSDSDLGNGTMNFVYNSCSVNAALTFFNPVRDPGSWRIVQ